MVKKFYQLTATERIKELIDLKVITEEDAALLLKRGGLSSEVADHMIENGIGIFDLPLGVAQNFMVNGRSVWVPMVIEESSVIAAASNGAKIVLQNGGFTAKADPPRMIGQIQVINVPDPVPAKRKVLRHKQALIAKLNENRPSLVNRGGGVLDLSGKIFRKSAVGPMLVFYLTIDVRDAMGANLINSALEEIAPDIAKLTAGDIRMCILSNYADKRLVHASCTIRPETLAKEGQAGEEVVERILAANALAEVDPYRAVTQNKGIMNGVDAVVIATGNDWRAVEAGAHSWACKKGKIRPLSSWTKDSDGSLHGELEMPLAVGIVGGATRVHPLAQFSIRMMKIRTSCELAEIIACVGLAQNLAALRALSTEGIQKGHMALHARQIAITAGAQGADIDRVAETMCKEGNIAVDHAKEILKRNEITNS
ncbi:MAG TPA: hydroxymethylglutaryl-CoA reductase, degradative [Flexilinea sp.]|nr:hydroxymethylglutaryl-CoA reductase, degradative [Flexilinea sp.]